MPRRPRRPPPPPGRQGCTEEREHTDTPPPTPSRFTVRRPYAERPTAASHLAGGISAGARILVSCHRGSATGPAHPGLAAGVTGRTRRAGVAKPTTIKPRTRPPTCRRPTWRTAAARRPATVLTPERKADGQKAPLKATRHRRGHQHDIGRSAHVPAPGVQAMGRCLSVVYGIVPSVVSPSVAVMSVAVSVPLPPLKRSAPDPPVSRSVPLPPPRLSSPTPPDRMSLPLSPHSRSLPSPPVSVSLLLWAKSRSAPGAAGQRVLAAAADHDRNFDRAAGLPIVDGDGQVRGAAAPVHGAYGHRPGAPLPAKATLPVGTSAALDEATLSVSAVAGVLHIAHGQVDRARVVVPAAGPAGGHRHRGRVVDRR